jgi:transposase-like protein
MAEEQRERRHFTAEFKPEVVRRVAERRAPGLHIHAAAADVPAVVSAHPVP